MSVENPASPHSPDLPGLPESFKTKKWQGMTLKEVLIEIAREYPLDWMRFGEYRWLPLELKNSLEAFLSCQGSTSFVPKKELLQEKWFDRQVMSLAEDEKYRREKGALWSRGEGFEPIDFVLRDKGIDAGWELAFQSVVCLEDGTWAYIPTLDLLCSPTSKNLEKIKNLFDTYMVHLLGSRHDVEGKIMGVFLYSGNSFQYCGLNLVKRWQWENFLKRSLYVLIDYKPDGTKEWLVDPAWIGHSLEQGSADLRLTNITQRKPIIPIVVDVWANSLQDTPPETVSK